jgi:DNA-binding MarR family transcriptional regulator
MTSDARHNETPTFAPLPARAIGDQRLTGLHLRVLAAICLHDRMSGALGKGQGCWASHKTLALKCGCNYTNLSTAISQLGKWGYVERTPNPMNKRLNVYRVIYTDDDKAVAKTSNSLPDDKQTPTQDGGIVCPDFREELQSQGVTDVEYISRSGEYITGTMEKNSAEAASFCNDAPLDLSCDKKAGTFLRKAEARLRANSLSAQEMRHLYDMLNDIECGRDHADPLHQWARRLLCDTEWP